MATADWFGAVQSSRKGNHSRMVECLAVSGADAALLPVLTAAVADYDRLQAGIQALAGAGPDEVARAEQAVKLAKSLGGIDREAKIDQAIAERSLAEGRAGTLRRLRLELDSLQEYFPAVLGLPSAKPRPLRGSGALPAATATACNQIRLNPFTTAWCDHGKPAEQLREPRKVRPHFMAFERESVA